MKLNDIETRMKDNYESIYNIKLTRRTPVIIRIDGKAFRTFTKNFNKPFDDILSKTMQETMRALCNNIGGCVFGYTQSDEISLLLIDYTKLKTSAWFDYKVQKVTSVAASIATLNFNKIFIDEYLNNDDIERRLDSTIYYDASETGALFDARCFNIPKEEVNNYFYWRQLDALRNSVEMAGHAYFSNKSLHKKSVKEIKEMLKENGHNWEDLPAKYKCGSCCYKVPSLIQPENTKKERKVWIVDEEIPDFSKDKNYIEQWILKEE